MGRKRDLKNVHPKRPPAMPVDDPEALNEWGEESPPHDGETLPDARRAQARPEPGPLTTGMDQRPRRAPKAEEVLSFRAP